jgi:prolyl-tRNA synthetase
MLLCYRVTLPLTQHDACVKSPHLLVPIEMGCYGIGVSRLMAAIAEAKHDENGKEDFTICFICCGEKD